MIPATIAMIEPASKAWRMNGHCHMSRRSVTMFQLERHRSRSS